MRSYVDKDTNELVIRLPIQKRPTSPTIGTQIKAGAKTFDITAAYDWGGGDVAVSLAKTDTTETAAFILLTRKS